MTSRRVRGIFVALLTLAFGLKNAAAMPMTDDNLLRLPAVGDYQLRVISPTILELTLINTTSGQGKTPIRWNFVSAPNVASLPAANEFSVTAGGAAIGVQAVGFKRQTRYAPLKVWDFRLEDQIYLQLSSPISDGQVVTVTNPDGTLFSMTYQAT